MPKPILRKGIGGKVSLVRGPFSLPSSRTPPAPSLETAGYTLVNNLEGTAYILAPPGVDNAAITRYIQQEISEGRITLPAVQDNEVTREKLSEDVRDELDAIPDPQVNADWDSEEGLSRILNRPELARVATSGDYRDLSNQPDINAGGGTVDDADIDARIAKPARVGDTDRWPKVKLPSDTVYTDTQRFTETLLAQLNALPNAADIAFDNHPVGTAAAFNALSRTTNGLDFVTITAAIASGITNTVDSDDTTSLTALAQGDLLVLDHANDRWVRIINLPTSATVDQATVRGFIDGAFVKGLLVGANAISYEDLTDKPTIPPAQVPSDWDANTGVSRILNKPDIPEGEGTAATLEQAAYVVATSRPTAPTDGGNGDRHMIPTGASLVIEAAPVSPMLLWRTTRTLSFLANGQFSWATDWSDYEQVVFSAAMSTDGLAALKTDSAVVPKVPGPAGRHAQFPEYEGWTPLDEELTIDNTLYRARRSLFVVVPQTDANGKRTFAGSSLWGGPYSNAAPAAATMLRVESDDGDVTLSWTRNPQAFGYDVRYKLMSDTVWGEWEDAGDTGMTEIPGLTDGAIYNFEVRSKNDLGTVGSVIATTETLGNPVALTAFLFLNTIGLHIGNINDFSGAPYHKTFQIRTKLSSSSTWGDWLIRQISGEVASVSATAYQAYDVEVRPVEYRNGVVQSTGATAALDSVPVAGATISAAFQTWTTTGPPIWTLVPSSPIAVSADWFISGAASSIAKFSSSSSYIKYEVGRGAVRIPANRSVFISFRGSPPWQIIPDANGADTWGTNIPIAGAPAAVQSNIAQRQGQTSGFMYELYLVGR